MGLEESADRVAYHETVGNVEQMNRPCPVPVAVWHRGTMATQDVDDYNMFDSIATLADLLVLFSSSPLSTSSLLMST
jgi:hypothetical protein